MSVAIDMLCHIFSILEVGMDRKIYLEFEEVYRKLWYIQQELKGVSNMQVSHMDKIDALQSKVDEHTASIDSCGKDVEDLQTSVGGIGDSVESLQSRMDKNMQSISTSISTLTIGQNTLTQGQTNLKNNINSLCMCPSWGYTQISIGSYKGNNVKVFTASTNGYAVIRGDFSGTVSYHVNYSFYQWATNKGCPFFALKAGDSVYMDSYSGSWSWADLYFVSVQNV